MIRRIRVVAATVFVVGAVLSPPGGASPGRVAVPGRDAVASATPLFSARRVPSLVGSLAGLPRLGERLDGVVVAGPAEVCIDVVENGRTLWARAVDQPLVPASNQKIVTARLVEDILGSDHRFRTEVAADVTPDGTVTGDLHLVGGGDPVLRTSAYEAYLGDDAGAGTSLEELADSVVAAGVRRVDGGVAADESRYDTERLVPGWPERYLTQNQLGPLSALEVDQGFVDFPDTWGIDTIGSLVPAENPARHAATVFSGLLAERGVEITGGPRVTVRPPDVPTIASIDSPPLGAIVAQLLDRSDNEIAELLVKEVGRVERGEGTTAAGLAVMRDALVRTGVDVTGIRMVDGSGLGYENRLTCGVLATLLDRAGPTSPLADGLAVGGETGTLRSRFTDPTLRGRIRAKTGSLDEVTALSGFAEVEGSPAVTFSYIANGAWVSPELLELQEELGRALVDYAGEVPRAGLGPR